MANPTLTYRTRGGDVTNAADLGVVFLSYRKKNVVYRNDVARDILDANDCAVWFDRNLTAGEDYNAEIDAALDRMNVFVLMVTPATFDPAGYVMKKEIPRALERKIPIIPIIVEETDMARFTEVLGDIHALDRRKPDEYEDGLKRALAMHLLTRDEKERIHMAQKESSASAARTIYYQGLGWLTGENCERTPEKGVQMITAAALSGEAPEALLRLAQMHKTGDGVTRNWQQAVEWYDQYTAAMEPHFGKNEDDDLSLAGAYDAKGLLLQSHGKLTAAKAAFAAYQQVCERMMTQYDGRQERALSISYERLGDICQAQGDLSGAKEYYLKALAIRERLAAESEGTQVQSDLSVSYNLLGDICKAQGDLSGAKEYYLKALAIRERLAAASEGTQAQDDLAVSYYKLGCLNGISKKERTDFLNEAHSIWSKLYENTRIDEYKRRMDTTRIAQFALKHGCPCSGCAWRSLIATAIITLIILQAIGVIDVREWISNLLGLFGR